MLSAKNCLACFDRMWYFRNQSVGEECFYSSFEQTGMNDFDCGLKFQERDAPESEMYLADADKLRCYSAVCMR